MARRGAGGGGGGYEFNACIFFLMPQALTLTARLTEQEPANRKYKSILCNGSVSVE